MKSIDFTEAVANIVLIQKIKRSFINDKKYKYD